MVVVGDHDPSLVKLKGLTESFDPTLAEADIIVAHFSFGLEEGSDGPAKDDLYIDRLWCLFLPNRASRPLSILVRATHVERIVFDKLRGVCRFILHLLSQQFLLYFRV